MEKYNHYYVLTEVFEDQPVSNYVLHSPEALLSTVAQLYSEWASDTPEDYATEIEFVDEIDKD